MMVSPDQIQITQATVVINTVFGDNHPKGDWASAQLTIGDQTRDVMEKVLAVGSKAIKQYSRMYEVLFLLLDLPAPKYVQEYKRPGQFGEHYLVAFINRTDWIGTILPIKRKYDQISTFPINIERRKIVWVNDMLERYPIHKNYGEIIETLIPNRK